MELNQIIEKLKEVSQIAGEFIADEALKFKTNAIEYKDVNNVVSYVDKEAENLIVSCLKSEYPNIGFITEEGTVESGDINGLNWIIDPLDGTANFVHGLPHYSVSLALAEGKNVLAGVVYNICSKDLFWAIKGGGAFRNGNRIYVSKNETFGQSLFATGFPYYKFEEMEKYVQVLESLMQKTHGLRRFGSAALDLAYVAAGMFDGFFEYNLNSWDMAAGVLLVTEAGGKVTDFSGGDNYIFGGDVVAGSAVQSELLAEIKRFW